MLNEVLLLGNLGAAPEIRNTQAGDKIANFSLATSESWKDKSSGERREKTEWHRVVCFGKIAEIADAYLQKGTTVMIRGKLRTRKWSDKNGVEKYSTEVVLDGFDSKLTFIKGAKERGEAGASQADDRPAQGEGSKGGADDAFDDDIPF